MAEKRKASPPAAGEEPPTKKTAGSENKEFVFETMKDIPRHLKLKKISNFFMEVIDLDIPDGPKAFNEEGNRANHCIARVVFQNKQVNDTDHAPAGATGLVIDLDWDGNYGTRCNSASLRVRTVKYDGAHRHAVKAQEIPIRQVGGGKKKKGRTVADFLGVLEKDDLIPCGFNTEGPRVRGCKDFL